MEIQGFVEEIDYNELQFLEIVGRGAFGVVSRARWQGGIDVAVKLIETESERKAFITELKQLSRISHPNIVRLYGACTKQPVCLVMEFAEGGSLYSVLHGKPPFPSYTLAHAVNWTLQCACGVEYLHAMKPKPLIHRDLKPPNLLLISGGTVVKICDFGTACDAHTHMTNNKGSAAWMAPEVFEGSNYSEKCDVFSWGIILWEVITRRKPFDEIGGSAFRVMWAVHSGKRPPLVKDCPKFLELLMTRCWSANPAERPSMREIVRLMTCLAKVLPGEKRPLIYSDDEIDETVCSTPSANQQPSCAPTSDSHETLCRTMHQLDLTAGEPVTVLPPTTPVKPVVIEDDKGDISSPLSSRQISRESLGELGHQPTNDVTALAASTCSHVNDVITAPRPIPPVRRHRRTGSQGTIIPASVACQLGHRRTGSYGNAVVTTTTTSAAVSSAVGLPSVIPACGSLEDVRLLSPLPSTTRSVSWAPGTRPQAVNSMDEPMLINTHNLLDPQLMPLPPCETCPESVDIYKKHCALVDECFRLQAEISQYEQRKQQLLSELQIDEKYRQNRLKEEYSSLLTENDELKLLHKNLLTQVEQLKSTSRQH